MGQMRESVKETGSAVGTVFGNPGLRRITLAFAGSKIGDWAFATAMTVWAFGEGGAAAVGIWYTVRLILLAVVTPFAAVLADRFPRRLVMIGADVVRVVLVLASAALIQWGDLPWLVYILATLAALVGAPFRPAQAALLPSLARNPTELTAANGTNSTFESLAFFLGPAIAGLLLTVADVPVVFVFDGLTFVWSALLVAGVTVPSAVPTPSVVGASGDPAAAPAEASDAASVDGGAGADGGESERGFIREAVAGFREIVHNRDLLLITWLISAQTIVAGASIVFTVTIAVDMIGLGPEGVGYLDSMLGVGAILGGLVAIGRASRQSMAVDLGAGVVLWSIPLLLVAVWPNALAAFAVMLLLGFANPLVDVNYETIVQRITPDRVMGRVFGASEAALISTMALGAALMPLLIEIVGLRWSLVGVGVGVTLLALPCFPALRGLDTRLRVPDGLDRLAALPLFAPLPRTVVERLAQRLERLEVPAGATIITEGDVGDRFYVVESGEVQATHGAAVLSNAGPGEPFGEIALLHDVRRTATVVATVPSVLWALGRDDFLQAVTGSVEARRGAEALVSRRIPTS